MTAAKAVAAPTDDTTDTAPVDDTTPIDAAAVSAMTDTRLGATIRTARHKLETARRIAATKRDDLQALQTHHAEAVATATAAYFAATADCDAATAELRTLIDALGT